MVVEGPATVSGTYPRCQPPRGPTGAGRHKRQRSGRWRRTAAMVYVNTALEPHRWGEIAGNGMAFEPVVDGNVVPAVPIAGIGAGAGVDVLVGSNSEEMRLVLLPTGVLDAATQSDLDGAVAGYRLPPATVSTYAAARPGASPGEVLEAISTDWFNGIPALRVAEAPRRRARADLPLRRAAQGLSRAGGRFHLRHPRPPRR